MLPHGHARISLSGCQYPPNNIRISGRDSMLKPKGPLAPSRAWPCCAHCQSLLHHNPIPAPGADPRNIAMNVDTQQIGQILISASQLFALPVEKNFKPDAYIAFASNNWPLCFGLVIGYLIVIFGGRKIMENRAPFDLRIPLALWNALLSTFSFIGMWRTMPYLLGTVLAKPYECTVCDDPLTTWGSGPSGLWVMLFIYSKIPELIDTVFIVLRKKPLIFLHWYHHVTVLTFCWSAYSTMAASGLYFVAMNFTVHALMYGYYCLQALNVCPKSFPAILITLSQIAQMFIGTGVCISCWYYQLVGRTCANDYNNLLAGAGMYGSYLYLFCDFAVRRYAGPKKSKKDSEKKLA